MTQSRGRGNVKWPIEKHGIMQMEWSKWMAWNQQKISRGILKKKIRTKTWHIMDKKKITEEFCESLASLWKVHPFREGNTWTTITFCCQYADEIGLKIDRTIFGQNSRYMRTALVAYNAYFADGSDFSKKEYLERIVFDAIQ